MKVKVTKENLLDLGYTKYKNNGIGNYDELYQKLINRNGIKFYINIKWYDFSNFPNMPYKFGWDSDVQFKLNDGETFNAEFFVTTDTTIYRIEEFYFSLFCLLKCRSI